MHIYIADTIDSSIRNTRAKTRIKQYADTLHNRFLFFHNLFFFLNSPPQLLLPFFFKKKCAFRSVSPALDPQVLKPSSSASAAYLSAYSSSSHTSYSALLLPPQPHTRFEDAAAPLSLLTSSHGALFASSQSLLDSHSSPRSFFILFFSYFFCFFFLCFER